MCTYDEGQMEQCKFSLASYWCNVIIYKIHHFDFVQIVPPNAWICSPHRINNDVFGRRPLTVVICVSCSKLSDAAFHEHSQVSCHSVTCSIMSNDLCVRGYGIGELVEPLGDESCLATAARPRQHTYRLR